MALTTSIERPVDQLVDRTTITALARVEAKLVARHPVLIVGVLLMLFQQSTLLWDVPTNRWADDAYYTMSNWAFLLAATFVVAVLAAMRDRERTTAETFRALPVTQRDRTVALLLAGLVPVAAATAVSAYVAVLVVRIGGMPVGEPWGVGTFPLHVTEIVSPVAQTAAAFAAGIATARIVRSRALGVVIGVVGSFLFAGVSYLWNWFPAAFLIPFAMAPRNAVDLGVHPSSEVLRQTPLLDWSDQYDSHYWAVDMEWGRIGWHSVFLVGLTLLFAGIALARSSGTRWHPIRLVVGGVLVAALGFAMQVWSTGHTFAWFEVVG